MLQHIVRLAEAHPTHAAIAIAAVLVGLFAVLAGVADLIVGRAERDGVKHP